MLKTIVAFANGEGGSVIFGVDDATHEVVGVGTENVAKLMDSLTDMICDACEPLIVPEIALRTFDGKTVIQVDVPAGNRTPYYLKKEGPQKGVYVRVGATTRVADAEVLQELQLAGARRTYDSIVERWGTGIQRVHDLCLENGLEPPEYVCDDSGVTVIYRRLPADADRKPRKPKAAAAGYTPAQEKLLAFIGEHGKVSVGMVMEHMACSRSTAMRHIGALLAQNLISKQGEYKNVRYVLV